jgi:hypothetical protein
MAKATETSITTIDDAPKATEPVATVKLNGKADPELSGKRVELTIMQDSGENGREPVFVGLNGTGYQIPRGIPVNVPVEVLEVLNNATMTVYESSAGMTVPKGREVKRFAYNVNQRA